MTEFQNNSKYDLEERTAKFGEEIRELWKECQELTLIFGKITSSLKN